MVLIRGLKGLCPCPVCLIPAQEQSNLLVNSVYCTRADLMETYNKVATFTQKDTENVLKPKSLRQKSVSGMFSSDYIVSNNNYKNMFWRLDNSNPHKAASWDHLHSYGIGIFGDYLWSNFKFVLKALGCEVQVEVNEQWVFIFLSCSFRSLT